MRKKKEVSSFAAGPTENWKQRTSGDHPASIDGDFKIGDFVVGLPECRGKYSITEAGKLGYVTEIFAKFRTEKTGPLGEFLSEPQSSDFAYTMQVMALSDSNPVGRAYSVCHLYFRKATQEEVDARIAVVEKARNYLKSYAFKTGDPVELTKNFKVFIHGRFASGWHVFKKGEPCIVDVSPGDGTDDGEEDGRRKAFSNVPLTEFDASKMTEVEDRAVGKNYRLRQFIAPSVSAYFPEAEMEELVPIESIKPRQPEMQNAQIILPPGYMEKLHTICRRVTDDETHEAIYESLGLHKVCQKGRGAIALMYGPPGTGKAQPLSSLVCTPDGKKKMGDIKIGDKVLTPDGGSASVKGVYPQGVRKVYELTFSDGRKVRADEDHLWLVKNYNLKKNQYHLKSTKDLVKKKSSPFYVPLTAPILGKQSDLPIDPWILGYLIGNGGFTQGMTYVSSSDHEVVERIKASIPAGCALRHTDDVTYSITCGNRGGKANPMTEDLRSLGLFGKGALEKFIPQEYLGAPVEKRIELLRGLLDSDGTCDTSGSVSYGSSSKKLAEQVQELVRGLGGIAKISTYIPSYTYRGIKKMGARAYNVSIRMKDADKMFTLKRKSSRVGKQYFKNLALRIESVVYCGDEETQCILVDHADHLYLTEDYVVTHNTMTAEILAEQIGRPLIKLNLGTITNPEAMNNKLKEGFVRAKRYRAVLLLDEVDIFIRRRGSGHPVFDENTSMFLRVLEWYDGILLMTTNLANQIDPAIFSRIHVCLEYGHVNATDRRAIWNAMLPKELKNALAGPDSHHENILDELQAININGREIKVLIQNVVGKSVADLRRSGVDLKKVDWARDKPIKIEDFLREAHLLAEQREELKK